MPGLSAERCLWPDTLGPATRARRLEVTGTLDEVTKRQPFEHQVEAGLIGEAKEPTSGASVVAAEMRHSRKSHAAGLTATQSICSPTTTPK
jgi:hypothetical protein